MNPPQAPGAYMTDRLRDAIDDDARNRAPDRWWCARCEGHRAQKPGGLCPVCEDQA